MTLHVWARFYLSIMFVQYVALAAVIVVQPDAFTGPSYESIRAILPGWLLASAFAVAGALAFLAAFEARDRLAHVALVVSAALCGFYAGGTLDAYVRGDATTTTALVLWASLAAKDLAVTRAPLSVPTQVE